MPGAWDLVRLARRPERPAPPFYVQRLVTGFLELRGDRALADDRGILAGIGRFRDRGVAVVAQAGGEPELGAAGLRKASRVLDLAERFALPVLGFVDTGGGHPTAPPHGPVWSAVGRLLERMMSVRVATLCVLCGEGVSGGALSLCIADRVVALEYAFLAATVPEAVSAILWRTAERVAEASELLRLTAADMVRLGLCTRVVPEGTGAHREPERVALALGEALYEELEHALEIPADARLLARRRRYLEVSRLAGA